MKKSSHNYSEAEQIASRNEQAKRLYRYVNDVARKIDEGTSRCKSVFDLYSISLEVYRQKLGDYCEKLLFTDPLAYGRKTLELLWRKGYYETISIAKKMRITEDDDEMVRAHLHSGIGYHHQLVGRLAAEAGLHSSCIDYALTDGARRGGSGDSDARHCCKALLCTCLVYLGDLCRYENELFEDADATKSSRYYRQAAYLDPSSGMPFNQLGTLFSNWNYNLDSVCYYIRCLQCVIPFDGAEENLLRLFDINSVSLEIKSSPENKSEQVESNVKRFIERFLQLVDYWYFQRENSDVSQLCNDTLEVLKLCLLESSGTKNEMKISHTIDSEQQNDDSDTNPTRLSPDHMYTVTVICLLCIHKLGTEDLPRSVTAKAFLVAVFSQLLQTLLRTLYELGFRDPTARKKNLIPAKISENTSNKHVEESTPEIKPTPERKNGLSKHVISEKDSAAIEVSQSSNDKNGECKKSNSVKLRRRRRRIKTSSISSEDSVSEGNASSEDEDASSSEDESSSDEWIVETDDSASDCENIPPKVEVQKDPVQNQANGETDTKESIAKSHTNNDVSIPSDGKDIDEDLLLTFLQGNNILPSIKLLQDWVVNESLLIKSCGETGEALFQSLVGVLNIFRVNFCRRLSQQAVFQQNKLLDFANHICQSLGLGYKNIPLPEDIDLRSTNIDLHGKDYLDWNYLKNHRYSVYEANVIRILKFIDFGHNMTKIIPIVRYNRNSQIFFVKKGSFKQDSSTKYGKKPNKEWKDTKRKRACTKVVSLTHAAHHGPGSGEGSLMRSLGKLWLQGQVRELESEVGRSGRRLRLPPYLALDTHALAKHSHTVKLLVAARKFVLLVPTVVVQDMDEVKKDCSGARDAIRWLEAQLRSGSRFIRTQRPAETRPLACVKYPRKLPKSMANFVQIVEFCHYFCDRRGEDNSVWGGNGDHGATRKGDEARAKMDKGPIIVLLTGSRETLSSEEQCKDFSYTGIAQTAGVSIEYIEDFHAKWKHQLNKGGKKR